MSHRLRNILWLLILAILSGSLHLAVSEEIRYGTGTWDAATFGNHRAVIRVMSSADAVRARIPWRRRDWNPEKKNLIVIEAATGARVKNVCPVAINREFGEFIFQPAGYQGDYFVYYLPWLMKGRSSYPTVIYPEMEMTADEAWLKSHGLSPFQPVASGKADFPEARVIELQSIDEWNSFFPMEVIATAEDTAGLVAKSPDAPYLLFPEDRRHSVRMADDLPYRWIQSGPGDRFSGEALRGEFYVFQIGVYACRTAIEDIDVVLGDLRLKAKLPAPPPDSPASLIPAAGMLSFNTRGINWDGRDFKKVCPVPLGKVQPLWCGVRVPKDVLPGKYEGDVTVIPKGLPAAKVRLSLDVKDEVLEDSGDSEFWRMSRLRWLDSRVAFDDETTPPFPPIVVQGDTFSCLGRSLTVGRSGFPAGIRSIFSPEVTSLVKDGREMLVSPINLIVETQDGHILEWVDRGAELVMQAPGTVVWEAASEAGPLGLVLRGRMEFDGFVGFKVSLSSKEEIEVKDIRLEIPVAGGVARYMMGLGFKGGLRPAEFDWVWDQKKNQDALWIGDVNAGFQFSLRAENYERPLNTNFYLSKPLNLPLSWWNEGKGAVSVRERDSRTVLVTASSGSRRLAPGEILHYDFNLLLTPFKTIDTRAHFRTRYFHAFRPVDEVAGTGANTINVHHANAINPYINYPFLRPAEMKKYIDEAHSQGMKVKIYYTIRELSNRAVELFALRSLGDEIFSRGPGGGFSWLQEHLVSDYIAAWFVPELEDAAIINSGMSRWHNYYLEGLDWLAKNVGIDGLYIDDVAFDRTTMKRVRKILDRSRPGALIDLHSANQHNPRDGFASSANLYLEHFPYLNRLWFGEYFDYNSAPDYWLVEISGIPFGLMGEMLQDGGNAWRGMVYGMTNRLPWSGQNPARLWKVWDEFGIAKAKMLGYWSPDCPVRTDNKEILATAYVKDGAVLIALASWAGEPVQCRLNVDWKALGLDEKTAVFRAPAIPDFQPEAKFKSGDQIPVDPGKGWLLILK
jgi:hypothetical protein